MSLNEKILKKLDMGMSSHITPQPMAKEHSHEECELYLLTAGICTYLIDDEMYTIRKGISLLCLSTHFTEQYMTRKMSM